MDTSPEGRDEALLRLDLPDREQAPSAARAALKALNGSLHLVSDPRLKDAQLLVSELVSNAVRHGGGGDPVRLTVVATASVMLVEVRDAGQGFDPGDTTPTTGGGGGWGLGLVASLAHRWTEVIPWPPPRGEPQGAPRIRRPLPRGSAV